MSPVMSCLLVGVMCTLAANAAANSLRAKGTRSRAAFVPQATDDQALRAKEPIAHKVKLAELQSLCKLYEDLFELDTESDKLNISRWAGRTGNNFYQLMHALLLAALNNKTAVSLPKKGSIRAIYDLPDEIPSPKVDSQFKQQSGCPSVSNPTQNFFYRHCSGVSRTDYMYMADHLRQYFKTETSSWCRAEDARKEDELIIHLRSGDLLSAYNGHFQSKFAPCGFFEHLIKQHKYQVVRIITEPDLKNPCVSVLQELKSELVVVQSHSVAEDACALMNARHLAVNALSTFSMTFGMIANHNLKALHVPFKIGSEVEPTNFSFDESSAHDLGGYFYYSVPGIDQIRSSASKIQYLRTMPESQVALASRSDLSSVSLDSLFYHRAESLSKAKQSKAKSA